MIEDAIGYPLEGEETENILLVGGLLGLASGVMYAILLVIGFFTFGFGLIFLPLAFVPTIGILGYYVRVLDSTVAGDPAPPAFDDLGRAFKDGLVATALSFVYFLVPTVLFVAVALFGGLLGGVVGGDGGGTLGLLFILLGFGVATLLSLGLAYVYPAALTRYAVTDDVAAAFAVGALGETLASADYLVAWLFGLVILFVGGFVATLVGFIPFVGLVVAPVIQFIAAISAYRAWGLAYLAGTEASSGATDGPDVGATV